MATPSRGNAITAPSTPIAPGTTGYADNGLNQYTSVGGASPSYDGRGNLTGDGSRTFAFDIFNRLTSVAGAGAMSLGYDPAGRLYETTASSVTTRFLYDGDEIIAEYNTSGTLQRRYVHGPGLDEHLTWYEGSGTADRRYLVQDDLGSVIANDNGSAVTAYSYDEYGRPNAWNSPASRPRFAYAGAVMLEQAQLYSMRARVYSPTLGRFLQTDPILHAGGMNLYAYVQNDPVNFVDPSGLGCDTQACTPDELDAWCAANPNRCVTVTGRGRCFDNSVCTPEAIAAALNEAWRGFWDSIFSGARDGAREAGEAVGEAVQRVDQATQCDTFRVGALAGGAMGFGGELQAGAQFDRGQNELSGFLDFEPAVGEGGALQGFVEHEFGDGGQQHASPERFRPRGQGGSRRGGAGPGFGAGGTLNSSGRPASYNFSVGPAEGGYSTGGGGTIARTPPLALGPANPNCAQQQSQPGG